MGGVFVGDEEMRRAISEAVELYNRERPHEALGYATPVEVYRGEVKVKGVRVKGTRGRNS